MYIELIKFLIYSLTVTLFLTTGTCNCKSIRNSFSTNTHIDDYDNSVNSGYPYDYDTRNNDWEKFKGKRKYGRFTSKQDGGSVIGILQPAAEVAAPVIDSVSGVTSYLPNLDFWMDLGQLVVRRSSFSPFVKLSRVVFESQECAELVSCSVSRMSKRHSPLQFMHTLLSDFPFDGDLAKRLKMGSVRSETRDDCGFNCSPFNFLNQSIETLNLLHKVMAAAAKK